MTHSITTRLRRVVQAVTVAALGFGAMAAHAEAPLKAAFERVLEDGGRDGDADCGARGAESVGRRGYDCLVLVFHGCHERDEGNG